MSCLLIIPAYEPDASLIEIVSETMTLAQSRAIALEILVINDGSSPDRAVIFEQLEQLETVTVLTQSPNQGKGAALKFGFGYALEQSVERVSFVVTADADGQHLPKDILNVAARSRETQTTVLGVRRFDRSVPLRSRFGNVLTRQLFRLIHGVDVQDTQTGLRAIRREDLRLISDIAYNRYEYEIEMLTALMHARAVEQVEITTVYEPGNPTSHFNPVVDSARVYWVLLRYILITLMVSLCEAILVVVLTALDATILTTLVLARAVSVVLFFTIARSVVFNSSGDFANQALYYILLVCVNLAFLYGFVWFAETQLDVPRIVAALIGNTFFFSINFVVQRNFIFFDKAPSSGKGTKP
ncbi:MAG: glycosyltransferase [Henriciella sp.]